jgi:hypothetical protein
MRMDSPDLRAWVLVMTVQSVPYLSAVLASIASALDLPARLIGHGYRPVEADEVYATVIDAAEPVGREGAPAVGVAPKLPEPGPGKAG